MELTRDHHISICSKKLLSKKLSFLKSKETRQGLPQTLHESIHHGRKAAP